MKLQFFLYESSCEKYALQEGRDSALNVKTILKVRLTKSTFFCKPKKIYEPWLPVHPDTSG